MMMCVNFRSSRDSVDLRGTEARWEIESRGMRNRI